MEAVQRHKALIFRIWSANHNAGYRLATFGPFTNLRHGNAMMTVIGVLQIPFEREAQETPRRNATRLPEGVHLRVPEVLPDLKRDEQVVAATGDRPRSDGRIMDPPWRF